MFSKFYKSVIFSLLDGNTFQVFLLPPEKNVVHTEIFISRFPKIIIHNPT